MGNAARTALGFARRAHDTFLQNVAEYLQEEGRDVPNRTEAEEFLHGVDRLRDDVDRLEARLKLLEPAAQGCANGAGAGCAGAARNDK
jgi:ubiquinone biosynthesis protein UbiJ